MLKGSVWPKLVAAISASAASQVLEEVLKQHFCRLATHLFSIAPGKGRYTECVFSEILLGYLDLTILGPHALRGLTIAEDHF